MTRHVEAAERPPGETLELPQPGPSWSHLFVMRHMLDVAKAFLEALPPGPPAHTVYRLMAETDPTIQAALNTRRMLLLQSDWYIQPYDADDDAANAAAELAEAVLENVDDLDNALTALAEAVTYGYAFVEIVWGRVTLRGFGSMWAPVELIPRPPSAFTWEQGVWWVYTKSGRVQVPEDKFIVALHQPSAGAPWGRSVLEPLRILWLAKLLNIWLWSEFNERFAGPTLIGRMPPGWFNDDTMRRKALELLASIRQALHAVVPEDVRIEPLEFQRQTSINAYDSFLRYIDATVARTILGSSLSVMEAEYGTRAQAEVHERTTWRIVAEDARMLQTALRNGLLRPLIRFNRPDWPVPYWRFNVTPPEDVGTWASAIKALVEAGARIPLSWLYDKLNITPPQGDEPVLSGMPPATEPPGGLP